MIRQTKDGRFFLRKHQLGLGYEIIDTKVRPFTRRLHTGNKTYADITMDKLEEKPDYIPRDCVDPIIPTRLLFIQEKHGWFFIPIMSESDFNERLFRYMDISTGQHGIHRWELEKEEHLTDEQIAELPTNRLRLTATNDRTAYEERKKNFDKQNYAYDLVRKCIEDNAVDRAWAVFRNTPTLWADNDIEDFFK